MRDGSEHFGCIFRLCREKKPLNELTPIFFLVGGIHDLITHAGFGDDRLRDSWVVWGSKFSISH